MPFGGRAVAASAPLTSLDALAESLAARGTPGEPPALFRWDEHQSVHVLRFGSAAAQKAALTRLSLFLEDRTHAGAVLAAPPTGRVAGPASYSGHNCRAEDAARFFNQARDDGVALSTAEAELKALLEAHGLLSPARDGRVTGAPGLSVLSVARGGTRDEARGTLLHEAMHGLFYADAAFAERCRSFWRDSQDDDARASWRAFLAGLGYDAANEELCINEFQAYMSTERQLFGNAATAAANAGGKRGKEAGSGEAAALAATQRAFGAFIAPHVPAPAPRVAGCACVFADMCGGDAAAGPLRLPKR